MTMNKYWIVAGIVLIVLSAASWYIFLGFAGYWFIQIIVGQNDYCGAWQDLWCSLFGLLVYMIVGFTAYSIATLFRRNRIRENAENLSDGEISSEEDNNSMDRTIAKRILNRTSVKK